MCRLNAIYEDVLASTDRASEPCTAATGNDGSPNVVNHVCGTCSVNVISAVYRIWQRSDSAGLIVLPVLPTNAETP